MTNLLNKRQAAEYLNVSERTVDYFRERGNLPFHVIGGERGKLVRFIEEELHAWVTGRSRDNDSNDKEEGNAKT